MAIDASVAYVEIKEDGSGTLHLGDLGPQDGVEILQRAQRIVRESSLWKRFIDGTPLENDIAVWMMQFALDIRREAAALPVSAPVWQDISTAPKDGTEILLFATEIVSARWNTHWWGLLQCGDYAASDKVDGEPTHWMPLPPTPRAPRET